MAEVEAVFRLTVAKFFIAGKDGAKLLRGDAAKNQSKFLSASPNRDKSSVRTDSRANSVKVGQLGVASENGKNRTLSRVELV